MRNLVNSENLNSHRNLQRSQVVSLRRSSSSSFFSPCISSTFSVLRVYLQITIKGTKTSRDEIRRYLRWENCIKNVLAMKRVKKFSCYLHSCFSRQNGVKLAKGSVLRKRTSKSSRLACKSLSRCLLWLFVFPDFTLKLLVFCNCFRILRCNIVKKRVYDGSRSTFRSLVRP